MRALAGAAARELIPALYGELRRGIELPAPAADWLEGWSAGRSRARRSPGKTSFKALGFDAPPEERLLALALQGYLTLAFVAQARTCLGAMGRPAPSENVAALVEPGPGAWTLAPGHPVIDRASESIVRQFDVLGGTPADPSLPGRLIELIVPPGFRRDLGEFYTPRWLVEQALELAGWRPTERMVPSIVDPTCGAGAFLVPAIQMAKRELIASGRRRDDVAPTILNAVRGFDLNPLSVLASRVAYLSCLDAMPSGWPLGEIPIRRRDVLLAPFQPAQREARAAFVVGNPPWIRWSDLPERQRQSVARAARHYDLIPANTWHGGSEVDLSAVVAFASSDLDLEDGGTACFVLPRAHLHAPASARFRALHLPDGTKLGLCAVADFDGVTIFAGASVQPMLMAWTRGSPDRHPVRCEVWRERGARLDPDAGWVEARQQLEGNARAATRLQPDDRIYLCEPRDEAIHGRLQGGTSWVRGRKGITTDLNGAYFVSVLGAGSAPGLVRVVNDRGRGTEVPRHEFEVEEALVYPLLKGAGQIERFRVQLDGSAALVPNDGIRKQLSEAEFRQKYPAAYGHFQWVEKQTGGALSSRSTYAQRMAKQSAAFFQVYNVGDYTFEPFKVVWPEISSSFRCGVVAQASLLPGGALRPVVADHKVYFAALNTEQAANFVCALLNAPVVRRFVEGTTAHLQVGTVLRTLRIPSFEPARESHAMLAEFGRTTRLNPGPAEDLERLDALVRDVLADP